MRRVHVRRLAAAGLILGVLAATRPALAQPDRLTAYVNPFVGTGGHGHTYPGPSLPFGMVQPGPDTRLSGWDGCSGYHYSDSRILGFSHTHLSGTGIPDYGDVLLMPVAGRVRLSRAKDGTPRYASRFSHAEEEASPGYYAVTLADTGVRVELTTTLRVGMHRYTFPRGQPAHVVLDLEHRDEVLDSSVSLGADGEITGLRRSSSWAKDQYVYFAMRFSRPFTSATVYANGRADGDAREARGKALQAVFDFGRDGGPLLVKVAISAVSAEGARKNLDAELPGWDFGAVRRAASDAWERELEKIRVEGGTHDQRTVFYTALYHAMLAPNVYMDVDGRYRGRDLRIHRADGFTYYTVFSLWDTFRALHPLLAIIDRGRTADFVRTFLQQYRDGGRLPVWELAGNETDTMIGYHAVSVIADALRQGIGGFDRGLALEAMEHSADEDRPDLDAYRRRGYLDAADAGESVSKTLEYAYDDWCIALAARALGRDADAARFFRRTQAYRNLYDPSTGFMRARMEGHWLTPFDPAEVNTAYTEANAWQYGFFVPQDVDGLMALHGGPAAFTAKLDALFTAPSALTGREQADITGLIGQYAHGNEPSHHIAYLYDYAGQPWKTQAIVRRLVDTMYAARPDGLSGNEDCGQMSAWLVLSALGFYPVAPGSLQYALGSPRFPAATIRLENGREFVIRADGVSDRAMYIQRATLDGRPYTHAYLDFAALKDGGMLDVEMGEAPNMSWGSGPGDAPRMAIDGPRIVPVPFAASGSRVFRDRTAVQLGDADPRAEVRCTIDGGAPTRDSRRCDDAPLTLTATTTVRAVAFVGDRSSGAPLDLAFNAIPAGRSVQLGARYANQYSAGGPDALIDGLRGGSDFRRGRWQGYRGTDLTAVVDLGRVETIQRVAMGFLQDTGAWIFMPREVRFEASEDGAHYRALGVAVNTVPARDATPVTRDFAVDVPASRAVRARYVRVTVRRFGTLPAWHPGRGEEAWFFADEIVVTAR